jgi:hypothetical protein
MWEVERIVTLLELEGQFVNDVNADGEGISAPYFNGDWVVVTIAETAAESALGSNSFLMPEQGDVGHCGHKQQQGKPPPYRIKRGNAEAGTRNKGNGEQQEVEAAS